MNSDLPGGIHVMVRGAKTPDLQVFGLREGESDLNQVDFTKRGHHWLSHFCKISSCLSVQTKIFGLKTRKLRAEEIGLKVYKLCEFKWVYPQPAARFLARLLQPWFLNG
ncbi:MAG TPA: hypothetical protein PL157_05340, partial [Acidobacteriota bacterium]|nr:hypothetical protein [Acidobacteriota bacterium]